MLRIDLEAAGIAYETASGVIDFHALRATYVSHLVSSGASVKTCQVLARHSTPNLTIGIYAKASLHDVQGAVERLPALNNSGPSPESMAATGTDGERISERFAHHLPTGGDGTGLFLTEGDGLAPTSFGDLSIDSEGSQPLNMTGVGDEGRELSAPVANAGGGNRTHTGVTPRRILSPLRLPFRHAGQVGIMMLGDEVRSQELRATIGNAGRAIGEEDPCSGERGTGQPSRG
jgi:hypothetical protein